MNRLAIVTLTIAALVGCVPADRGFGSNGGEVTDPGGDAVMELSATEFVFEDLEVGKAQSAVLVARNVGDATLDIASVTIEDDVYGDFYTPVEDNENIEIVPGGDHEFTIVCQLVDEHEASATLKIDSNDSTRPVTYLPLIGHPLAAGDTGDSGT